jgi:hypothetical protein
MNTVQDFMNMFKRNVKGNWFSVMKHCTIYHAGDSWYYCMIKDHKNKYGRKEFTSPIECYNYLLQKHILNN